jgi:hypothetical protein
VDRLGQLPYRHVQGGLLTWAVSWYDLRPASRSGPNPCDSPSHGGVQTGIFWQFVPAFTNDRFKVEDRSLG